MFDLVEVKKKLQVSISYLAGTMLQLIVINEKTCGISFLFR